GFGGGVVTVGWQRWRWCRRWGERRVRESGVEGRIDRVMRKLFRFAGKISPEKFFDGGLVAAGGRPPVNKFREDKVRVNAGNGSKSNATTLGVNKNGGNDAGGQARVFKCYNYQGEGHMARQCTQPKRPRNSAWFKEKLMLVEAHESSQVLDEEQLAFLADPGFAVGQDTQTTMPLNAAFQTDDLDAFDSDYDEAPGHKQF
nr:hypothetical protein [Tanacetum cinerariifolium]